MFFPARMKKVSIIVHEKYLNDLVSALHESSLIEMIDSSKSDNKASTHTKQSRTLKDSAKCASFALRINRILDVLEQVAPEPQGLNGKSGPQSGRVQKPCLAASRP